MSDTSDSETSGSTRAVRSCQSDEIPGAGRPYPAVAGGRRGFVVLAVGLYLGFTAPEDFQQGITVRIMYIHVPFAWLVHAVLLADGAFGAWARWSGAIRWPTWR